MIPIKTPSELAKELAERLKALRLANAWSREELGKRAGVSPATLKRFELTGQISLERLLKLSFALDAMNDFDNLLLPRPVKSIKDLERASKTRQRGRTSKS